MPRPSHKFFHVVDFDDFQHYRDRNPPWIKLYFRLFGNYRFTQLTEIQRFHCLAIFSLASQHDNTLPIDPNYISLRIGATTTVDLNALLDAGFIQYGQAPSRRKSLASREQDAMLETETETETERTLLSDVEKGPEKANPPRAREKPAYGEAFETFWTAYPTDKIMSKKAAAAQWGHLSAEDQAAALAAVPGFLEYCKKNPTYRPVHAERFLSQRRFDGFKPVVVVDLAKAAAARDRADQLLHRGKYAGEIDDEAAGQVIASPPADATVVSPAAQPAPAAPRADDRQLDDMPEFLRRDRK